MKANGYHILTKIGDATGEVDLVLGELGGEPADAGLHRHFFVTRANQTVVMVSGPDAPIAAALRSRRGWQEPGTQE